MLINTFFGSIIFLLTNGALLYTAHLVVRRFVSYAPSAVRLVSTGTLYYALIIVIFQALSPFHAITKTGVSISCLAVAFSAHLMWGRYRDFQADLQPLRGWVREGLYSRWAVLISICGFVVLLSLSRALLMPPLSWDSLTYHLTFAALWIQKGTLEIFNAPDQMLCAHMPINGEIFASWLLLPFHNDLLVNTTNFPITLLGGIACYAIARELGLSRKDASWAPVLICFAPMLYTQITTQYVDIAVFAFSCTAVLFTIRQLKSGHLHDLILAFIALGLLLGTKYNAIPSVGLMMILLFIKIARISKFSMLQKMGLMIGGTVILCLLGGMQYLLNSKDAHNPVYPFPVKVFSHTIFEGWGCAQEINQMSASIDNNKNLLTLLRSELNKFSYGLMSAGPKFPLFLMFSLFAVFMRHRSVSRKTLYVLTLLWVVPLVILYNNSSADFATKGFWRNINFRYFSSFIALFTIQGLLVFRRFCNRYGSLDFLLAALVVWDLLHADISHIEEVAALYPLAVLLVPLVFLFYKLTIAGGTSVIKRWGAYTIGFIICAGALYFLQIYRDNTRYIYYQQYTDLHDISRDYVAAWKLLDKPDEKKVIALTKGWSPLSHTWFFYPLMGSRLQNDILYVSTKYRDDVPAWVHRGSLRGEDVSAWLHNLKKNNVDYILVQTPWPVELGWMTDRSDEFLFIAEDKNWKIFRYRGIIPGAKPFSPL